MSTKTISLFDREIMMKAVADSFKKLDPRLQLKNPVMFVTLLGAILTFEQLFTTKEPLGYVLQIALWLLFTVVFANFAVAGDEFTRDHKNEVVLAQVGSVHGFERTVFAAAFCDELLARGA